MPRHRAVVLACAIVALATTAAEARSHHHGFRTHHRYLAMSAGEIVAHPTGCPHRAFCGCGTSVKLFGHPIRRLFLAREWLRFPRAAAAPGMAAVFRHGGHVAAILAAHNDGTATVYDPNSGHHLTRIHRRDIRHAIIVNPHSGA